MQRMRRALSAIKTAEMVQLGQQVRAANQARTLADELRSEMSGIDAPSTVAEMLACSNWQGALQQRARAADVAAAEAEQAAMPLRAKLSRTLGRETVTDQLLSAFERERHKALEKRAEDVPSVKPNAI